MSHYQGAFGWIVGTAAGGVWLLTVSGRVAGSPEPNCTAAATLRQAIARSAHQDHWVACSPSPHITRGGVTARVQISMCQKLKRPLPSTDDYHRLNEGCYHIPPT